VRSVYLGTSAFAGVVLDGLMGAGEAPVLVITRPDAPRGRGRRLAAPPVADCARRHGIELVQPADINAEAARATIAAAAPEVVVVCAFGALIREPLLSEHEILNVHPSLLPRWRGAAPIERAIMAGDESTGVSIMRLTAGLDSGPVGPRATETIRATDTYGSLGSRLAPLGARLLIDALRRSGAYAAQDEAGITYAEKITAADRRLDPTRPALCLERVVRALHPHIGARLELSDASLLGVQAARAHPDDPLAPAPGELRRSGGRLVLGANPGSLELLEVKAPGARAMAAGDYLRGRSQH